MYQYKVVKVDHYYYEHEEVINRYASQGWEFFFAAQDNCNYDFFLYFRKRL